MNKQEWEEYYKIIEEIISEYNYRMKADVIATLLVERLKKQEKEIPVKYQTIRKHVIDYLTGIDYYGNNSDGFFKRRGLVVNDGTTYVVYGILLNNRIVYIGKTKRGFALRVREHKAEIKKPEYETCGYNSLDTMYRALKGEDVSFVILYEGVDDFDIQYMEKYLIKVINPKFNRDGRTSSYSYKIEGEDSIDLHKCAEVLKESILKVSVDWRALETKNLIEDLCYMKWLNEESTFPQSYIQYETDNKAEEIVEKIKEELKKKE